MKAQRERKEHKAAKCPRCAKRVALKQDGSFYKHWRMGVSGTEVCK